MHGLTQSVRLAQQWKKSEAAKEAGIGLFLAQSEHTGIHVNIFAPGEFRIEARAEFQQCCDAAIRLNAAAAWIKRATDHLQQGRFTAAITPDDANGFAFFDLKRNIFERPKFTKVLLGWPT